MNVLVLRPDRGSRSKPRDYKTVFVPESEGLAKKSLKAIEVAIDWNPDRKTPPRRIADVPEVVDSRGYSVGVYPTAARARRVVDAIHGD